MLLFPTKPTGKIALAPEGQLRWTYIVWGLLIHTTFHEFSLLHSSCDRLSSYFVIVYFLYYWKLTDGG